MILFQGTIWDDKTQGFALSAYNYGFILSPVIGGYIALYSAKYVLMVSMLLSAAATALTPWSVTYSPYMTCALRAVVGICGVNFCFHGCLLRLLVSDGDYTDCLF